MTDELVGKVALITGGSRGIGRAIAGELARRGADLLLVARTTADLELAVREIGAETGRRVAVSAADLRRPEGVAAAVQALDDAFGRLDILVNNAGATRPGDFLELGDDAWEDGFALKFYGAVRLSRALWPKLVHARGSVVNVSGDAADAPDPDFMIGGAVNAALSNVSKALARRGLDDDVNVNVIHPGSVRTERLVEFMRRRAVLEGVPFEEVERRERAASGARGFAEPADVAALVAFLVSPRARHVHGTRIVLDGGASRSM